MRREKLGHSRVSEKQDTRNTTSDTREKKFKAQQGSLSEKQDNSTLDARQKKKFLLRSRVSV